MLIIYGVHPAYTPSLGIKINVLSFDYGEDYGTYLILDLNVGISLREDYSTYLIL